VHAEQPEPGDLGDQLTRKGARLEVLRDDREEAGADEVADGVADEALLVGEEIVDREEVRWRRWRDAPGGLLAVGLPLGGDGHV
jgi:hypothetical protein